MDAIFDAFRRLFCLNYMSFGRFSFAEGEEGGGGAGEQVGEVVGKEKNKESGKKKEEGGKSSDASSGKVLTEDQYKLLIATRDRKSKEQLEELNSSYQSAIKQLKDEIAELKKSESKKNQEDDTC